MSEKMLVTQALPYCITSDILAIYPVILRLHNIIEVITVD